MLLHDLLHLRLHLLRLRLHVSEERFDMRVSRLRTGDHGLRLPVFGFRQLFLCEAAAITI